MGHEGFVKDPVGCGPYKIKEYKPGDRVVFERWEGQAKAGIYRAMGTGRSLSSSRAKRGPVGRCDKAVENRH